MLQDVKYHNSPCLSRQNFKEALFLFSFGIYHDPKRNWKQSLKKMLEGQRQYRGFA